ncbi:MULTISPECIES: hypothetical protein [unclassified Bizionia]|uniref:hypothetical protein n=1 Tax=unclassified Bizionia TaxID=2626393 RepID=UPI00206AB8F0|nr:hypothetical protein [Bizionia sp. M204]UPS92294.1 hypothetical protein GMA17_11445 [Bizionia sp. M204]
MDNRFITIKEVAINNNCPECYNTNGLHFTFKQKFVETSFYKSLTTETAHELFCKTCETTIYPVNWTDDIDRVFDYHKRAFVPKKASFKLKKSAWIGIGVLIGIIVVGIGATVFLS